MKKNIYIFTLFFMALILAGKSQVVNNDSTFVANNDYTVDTSSFYFPTSILIDTINFLPKEKDSLFYQKRKEMAKSENMYFSRHLKALKEPKLYENYEYEAYRFTWLRTFNNPVAIRLEKREDKYFLFVKKTNGAGGYNPGRLVRNYQVKITQEQWDEVQRKIYNMNFWSVPTIEQTNMIVMDGSTWIFEAKKGEKYHMAYRHATQGSEVKELCMLLLNMSGLRIKKEEMY